MDASDAKGIYLDENKFFDAMDYSFIAIDEDQIDWKEQWELGMARSRQRKTFNFLWRGIHAQPFPGGSYYCLSHKQRPHFYVSRN